MSGPVPIPPVGIEMELFRLQRMPENEVALSGALAAESVPQFEEEIYREAQRPPRRVDLSSCTFLDSNGVTALLRLDAHLRAAGDRLGLIDPSGPCRRVLEICGLGDVFEITSTQARDPSR